MIKPTSLWNFIHECEVEDAEYIGRICLALAGKSVEFSRAEKIQFLAISKDNHDMDERIAEKKEKDRERKKKWKDAEERGRTRKNAEAADSASPSIHPSVHPLQEDTHSPARAREGDFPTLDAVLAWAAQNVNHPDGKAYPTDWAKEWYETMRTATPPWTNVKGESVLTNWKNAMTWAWKRHLKLDKENGKGGADLWKSGLPPGAIYQQEGYDANKRLGL